MKASWKRFLAGVAAAAMTLGGFALGAGAAMAAIGRGSSDDNPLKETTTDTTARIEVRDDLYESHADRYKAYLVAAYDMDNVKPAASNADYLDIETLKYTQGDLPDATLKTALTAAGVDSSTLTDTDAIYSALKTVATQSPNAPYGYTDTAHPGTPVATERKFADALGLALDAMSSTDLGKLTSTKITPIGHDTFGDAYTLTDENSTAVPKTGLYLVWDTMKDTHDTTETSTRSVPMLVSSTLYKAPNTVLPGPVALRRQSHQCQRHHRRQEHVWRRAQAGGEEGRYHTEPVPLVLNRRHRDLPAADQYPELRRLHEEHRSESVGRAQAARHRHLRAERQSHDSVQQSAGHQRQAVPGV